MLFVLFNLKAFSFGLVGLGWTSHSNIYLVATRCSPSSTWWLPHLDLCVFSPCSYEIHGQNYLVNTESIIHVTHPHTP